MSPLSEMWSSGSTTSARKESVMKALFRWQPACRRVILDFHHLPPITQNRYLQLGVVQRFIVREVRRRSPAHRIVRRSGAAGQISL